MALLTALSFAGFPNRHLARHMGPGFYVSSARLKPPGVGTIHDYDGDNDDETMIEN